MTDAPIPMRVDGKKLVDINQQLTGIIDSAKLTRLAAATTHVYTPVQCHVEFFRDPERFLILSGDCSVRVGMECQRCLNEVQADIRSEFELGLVLNDEQAKKLPRRLIEDEILLCLPDFPMHGDGECTAFNANPEKDNSAEELKRPNPFEVLAQLKQK
jgi:uncharacterized protein